MQRIRPRRRAAALSVRALAHATIVAFLALTSAASAQQVTAPADTRLEPVVVTASPFDARVEQDVSQPATILRGDDLRAKEGGSLGATLANEIGVQSSAYGAGAGRPIIRGMDSARVRITESGIGVADVSGASPDHRVAADTLNARQVEILRGPATLLYGSGAIGGLVNIVSERIPLRLPARFGGEASLRGASAEHETAAAFDLNAPLAEQGALRLEGVKQKTGDYELAEPLRDSAGDAIAEKRLPNSQTDTQSVSIGSAWFVEAGSFGAAVQRYESDYGIPNVDDPVTIKLHRTRVDTRADLDTPFAGFSAMRAKLSYTDYAHTEYEAGGAPGAHFGNHGFEGRVELPHPLVAGWNGVVGLQFQRMTTQGSGEGNLPETSANTLALFVVEERRFGALRYELGARVERERYEVSEDAKPSRGFGLATASGGAFWRVAPEIELGASLALSQRAPSVDELYFEGAHPATFAYEIGDPNLRKERARNIEISLRKSTGYARFKFAAYENRFRDYIYGSFDGSTTDLLDDHGNVEDTLSNLFFRQDDARFRGFEAELGLGEERGWRGRIWGDLVRAVLISGAHAGDNLPRISPARAGVDLGYAADAWSVLLALTRVLPQNRTAAFDLRGGAAEAATNGYTMLTVGTTWRLGDGPRAATVFIQGRNLLDANAHVHTSYLRDFAPLAGRSLVGGMRFAF